MTSKQDFQDIVVIIIALDLLYNNFNITTTSLLKFRDKTINQIQSILQSRKAKNISKYTIKAMEDLVIVFKDNNSLKKKTYRDGKYFNYYKLGYFR